MGSRRRRRRSGCSVSVLFLFLFVSFVFFRRCLGANYFAPVDFVLSKVTPTLVTDLGYKIFLMFGAINIGGMATFALYVSHPCLFFWSMDTDGETIGSSLRPRAAPSRRWTSSSARSLRTSVKRTSTGRSGVRYRGFLYGGTGRVCSSSVHPQRSTARGTIRRPTSLSSTRSKI